MGGESAPVRNRVLRYEMVKASELTPHPLNWRVHPAEQRDVLRAILDEVGFAGTVTVYEDGGRYVVIDGHLRRDLAGDEPVPVLVVGLTPAEAKLLLATRDPLAALAESDKEALEALLVDVDAAGFGSDVVFEALRPRLEEAAVREEPGPGPGEGGAETRERPARGVGGGPCEIRFLRWVIPVDGAALETMQQSIRDWVDAAGISHGWGDQLVDNLVKEA